jgi:ATP-dependent exoDNAse (exonuclease V) alpha subunit
MILKGNQRGFGQELARHLLNVDDNEHAEIHELRGFMSSDLSGAFKEIEAISLGTKCQQYLYSLGLNPPQNARVSVAAFERAIEDIERRLGLSGQPRAIVFHEKNGRRHAHCVWSRINLEKMRAIDMPHTKYRLRDISRELYIEHGWDMPNGLRDPKDRMKESYSGAEAKQARRAKENPAELKKLFLGCWEQSDSRTAFAAALWQHGFCLARGDRRGFVAVDADGEVYSLSRWLGVKPKAIRARLGHEAALPSLDDAVTLLNQSKSDPEAVPDHSERDFKRTVAALEEQQSELVARQRDERAALRAEHETRSIREIQTRSNRLPTGIKGAWARLTGQYERLCTELAEDAANCAERDSHEKQALIDRHLNERRVLERKFKLAKAEFEFFADGNRPNRQAYGLDPNQPLILPREIAPFSASQLEAQPDLILGHISEKQARFTRTDVARGLAEFFDDAVPLSALTDQAMTSRELVQMPGSDGDTYTTKEFVETSRQLMSQTRDLSRSGGFRVSDGEIARAIQQENTRLEKQFGSKLSDEQVAACEHLLAPNQLSCVVGLAGAGKSTLLSVAREAWERQGFDVYGAALAGKAADSLQSASGISSRTLASLEASWKSGYEPVGSGSVVVIDEAGMVGTRQLARVTNELQKRGCKLVLIGDPDQLQPIEAGTPFATITEKTGAARLSEIRRQKAQWQRQASVELAKGQTEAALQTYADHDAVHVEQNRDQAIAGLVEDYMASYRTNGDTKARLALAHRRKDVHALNQAIRSARKIEGNVGEEIMVETETGTRAFAAGDRLLFTRNDKSLDVRNGMLATVTEVSDGKIKVRLDTDDEGIARHLTISPNDFPYIDHGFAVSIHRAQGCTVDQSYVLSSRSMDENLAYVAMTRHREEAQFYTANEISRRRANGPRQAGALSLGAPKRNGPMFTM